VSGGENVAGLPEAEILRLALPGEPIERESAEGFRRWQNTRHGFVPAAAISLAEWSALPPRRKALHNLHRKATHTNLSFLETPMSAAVARLVRRRIDNNSFKHKPATRAGVMVNGGGGQGKTETVLEVVADFANTWLLVHEANPHAFPGHRDAHIPIVYVQTPATAKPISTCKAILAFFDAPTGSRWTLPDYLHAVRTSLRDHGVKVLVLDDITRLRMGRVDDQDTLDMIRSLMSMSVTLVLIGVDIVGHGLLREGKYDPRDRRHVFAPEPSNKLYLNDDPAATQTERRFDLVNLNPFSYDDDADITAWTRHLVGIEQQIRLFKAPPTGLLTGATMPEYLFERTGGIVGLLERLIEDGCHLAIDSGTETLTESLLDEIDADIGDDPHRDAATGEVPSAPPRPAAKPAKKTAPGRRSRKNGSFDDTGPLAAGA